MRLAPHKYCISNEESVMHSYTTGSEHKTILHCLEQYRLSIEGADNPALAEAVWATTPEVTMIHPLGHELGWEAIRSNFYEKTMAARFSSRTLRIVNTPVVHIYANAAIVEFDWDFVATARADGALRHTMGRESQVWVRSAESGWKLVHVHYSSRLVQGAQS